MSAVESGFYDRIKQRMAARQQASGQVQRPKRRDKTRQNVVHNRFDRKMWGEARDNDQIDTDINDLLVGDLHGEREAYDNAPELMQDMYYSLYKATPRMEPKRFVEKDARLNRKVIESMQESPYWEELRDKTVLDDTLSTMALTTITDSIREIILREQEAVRESNRDKHRSGDPMNNPTGCFPNGPPGPPGGDVEGPQGPGGQPGEPGDKPGEPGGEGEGPGQPTDEEPDGPEGKGQGEGEGESDEGEGEDEGGAQVTEGGDEDDFDSDPDLDGDEHDGSDLDLDMDETDFERMLEQAVRDANDEIGELETLRRGIGLEDGEWKSMSPEARMKMAERLNTPQIKAAAEIFGQMKRMALGAQATKIIDVPHEAYDVTTGDQIQDALGSEFALLDDEDTELEFYRRYLEKEMLVYKKRGTEDAGRGPIIVAIDKSGSMNGRPFTWAMGVAEALRRICAEQERDYYAMFFGSNNDRNRFAFDQGKGPFEQVLAFLSVVANGGTQFDGVLEEAIARVAKDYEAGKPKADIVFITDGQAHLDEGWLKRFNEEKERVGCRIFGIYIGGAYDMRRYGSGATQVLEAFCDAVIPVSDLTADEVKEVFAAV